MRKVQLAYGRVDVATFDNCPRCKGSGRAETAWRSGVYEVCPVCSGSGEQSGRTFTYRSNLDLEIGDIVLVPATWVDEMRGDHATKEATVVRIGSDYTGETAVVLEVLERARP